MGLDQISKIWSPLRQSLWAEKDAVLGWVWGFYFSIDISIIGRIAVVELYAEWRVVVFLLKLLRPAAPKHLLFVRTYVN